MATNSLDEDVPYFVWPYINYFPVLEGQDEDNSWRCYEKATERFVIPAVSFLGMVGNISNMILLLKGKLNRSSTWLILALAAADTTFLFGVNNVPSQLYARGRKMGFDYPELQAKVLYHVYLIQKCFEIVGKVASMMLPCLITIDRLVAVIAPFRYPSLITVTRVRTAIIFAYLISTIPYIIFSSQFRFQYIPVSNVNITSYQEGNNVTFVGIFAKSTFYITNRKLFTLLVQAFGFFYGPVNLILTVIGCFILGVWMHIYTKDRKNLLANKKTTKRETRFKKILQLKKTSAHYKKEVHYKISSAAGLPTSSILDPHRLHNVRLTGLTNLIATVLTSDLKIDAFDRKANQQSCHKTFTDRNKECEIEDNKTGGRLKVVNKQKLRTTKTLLSVCSVYSVANTINFFVLFYFAAGDVPSLDLAIGLETTRMTIMVLNSACNFFFYVGLNRNLNESYRKCWCIS